LSGAYTDILAVVLPCAGEYRFVRVVPVLIFVRGPNLCWLCVASNALASSGHRRSGALQAAASGWHRPRPRITLIQNDDPRVVVTFSGVPALPTSEHGRIPDRH
jgi:hypothetical protein